MGRLIFGVLCMLCLWSCEFLTEDPVTQQDLVGEWDIMYAASGYFLFGDITIDKYGNAVIDNTYINAVKPNKDNGIIYNAKFVVSGRNVTISSDCDWLNGTFKIKKSQKHPDRYLIDPQDNGSSTYLIQPDIDPESIVYGFLPW